MLSRKSLSTPPSEGERSLLIDLFAVGLVVAYVSPVIIAVVAIWAFIDADSCPPYKWLDSLGMIMHNEQVSITATPDWLVGESKTCASHPSNPMNKVPGDALSFVICEKGSFHDMKVQFWGRKLQPEFTAVYWRCERNERGFVCEETSAEK